MKKYAKKRYIKRDMSVCQLSSDRESGNKIKKRAKVTRIVVHKKKFWYYQICPVRVVYVQPYNT